MCQLVLAGKESGIACASTRLCFSPETLESEANVSYLSIKASNAKLKACICAT